MPSTSVVLLLLINGVTAQCQAPEIDSPCFDKVMAAMLDGFNPEKFPGLTVRSSFTDFQAFFWNLGMYNCSRPCMPQEEACTTFNDAYPCYQDVLWARNEGYPSHPEWYPELSPKSTLEDIAIVLYRHGQKGCPRPCDEGEANGHFVPYIDQPQQDSIISATDETVGPAFTDEQSQSMNVPYIDQPPHDSIIPTTDETVAPAFIDEESQSRAKETDSTQAVNNESNDGPGPDQQNSDDELGLYQPASKVKQRSSVKLRHHAKVPAADKTDSTTASKLSDDTSCFREGTTYRHLDMRHAPATVKATPVECRDHCRNIRGAGFFQYYEPLSLCHCIAAREGQTEDSDAPFVGGPLVCQPAEASQLQDVEQDDVAGDDCYEWGVSYEESDGDPPPVYVQDSTECQRYLQQHNGRSTHFVFFPSDGSCRLASKRAESFSEDGAVSGPRYCRSDEFESKILIVRVTQTLAARPLLLYLGLVVSAILCAGSLLSSRRGQHHELLQCESNDSFAA